MEWLDPLPISYIEQLNQVVENDFRITNRRLMNEASGSYSHLIVNFPHDVMLECRRPMILPEHEYLKFLLYEHYTTF